MCKNVKRKRMVKKYPSKRASGANIPCISDNGLDPSGNFPLKGNTF